MATTVATKKWQGHEGPVMTSANGFEVIDCKLCEFKHIVPIPTEQELEKAYRHDYYTREKPLYIERYREDLDWWNVVYTRRYEIMEQHLPAPRRRLLDIGSGPGFFLLNGQKRGWTVKGIEPSLQASDHSRGLGLDIENAFFSETTAPELGLFDAINMSEVLEHIPDPAALLTLVHRQLSADGVVCIVVPNDFNPFQIVLRDHLGFKPWWVAPPHHVNYFDFTSLSKLVERHGFEVVHEEATFPIDMFLLMGDNYIGNDALGRASHAKRKNFEMALQQSGSGKVLASLYSALARQGLGREIVMYARKHA
jgi:SAM-dependent methyltransferase